MLPSLAADFFQSARLPALRHPQSQSQSPRKSPNSCHSPNCVHDTQLEKRCKDWLTEWLDAQMRDLKWAHMSVKRSSSTNLAWDKKPPSTRGPQPALTASQIA